MANQKNFLRGGSNSFLAPKSQIKWSLKSADGKDFGDVSAEAYRAVYENSLHNYKPKDKKEESTIAKFRKHLGTPLSVGDSMFGNVSYDAYIAIVNGKLDDYKPVNNEEKKVLDDYKKSTSANKESYESYSNNTQESNTNEQSVAERYGIDANNFTFNDLAKWANEHNHKFETTSSMGVTLTPKYEGGFLGIGGKKQSTDQEDADAKILYNIAKNNANKKASKSPTGKVLGTVGYTAEKIAGGAADAVADVGDYALAGLHWAGGKAAEILLPENMEGAITKKAKEAVDYRLNAKTLGDVALEDADKRFADSVPKWYKEYIAPTAEAAGAMTPAIVAEVLTLGASPMLDLQMAKMATTTPKLGTTWNATKNVLKQIATRPSSLVKPSEVIFGTGAAASATKQAYGETGDLGKSVTYGLLTGLGEVATERLFGGFAGTEYGEAVFEWTVKNKALRKLLNIGSEAVEEMLMKGADTFFKRATIDPNAALPTLKEIGESGLQGILLSTFMGVGTMPVRKMQKTKAINTINTSIDSINELIPNPDAKITPLDKKADYEAIEEKQKEIRNFTDEYADAVEYAATMFNSPEAIEAERQRVVAEAKELENSEATIDASTGTQRNNFTGELDEIASTEMPSVNVGDSFFDKKLNISIKVMGRDANNTTIETTNLSTGAKETKPMPNNMADSLLVDDRYTKVETPATSTTEESSEASDTQAPKNINLRKVGKNYEVYGNDALTLASEIDDLETTRGVVNGVETDVLRIPANLADGLAKAFDGEYNLVMNDKPVTTTPNTANTTVSKKATVENKAQSAIPSVRVGEVYKSNDTDESITIVGRDAENTTVLITNSKGSRERAVSNKVADAMFSNTDKVKGYTKTTSATANSTDTTANKNVSAETNDDVAENATTTKTKVSGAEVLKNEPESDTIESKAEKTSVEREDNSDERRSNSVSGNSRRRNNGSTRKQNRKLFSFERKNKGKDAKERYSFARELINRGQVEEVKIRNHTINRVKKEAYNEDMLSMVEEARKKGVELVFFVGSGQSVYTKDDGTKVTVNFKGLKLNSRQIFVQYDHEVSPQKIAKHETIHAKWFSPEFQEVKDSVLNSLDEEEKQKILSQKRYANYKELHNSEDIALEEFVCDVMSGMNEYTEQFADVVTDYWYENESAEGYNPSTYAESIDAGGNKSAINRLANIRSERYNLAAVESHKESLEKNYNGNQAEVDYETLVDMYNEVLDIWNELGGELNSEFLNEWNEKKGSDRAFTLFKKQMGYKYNIELSTMCKKGVALFEAIDTIVKKEVAKKLNTDTIGKAEKEILYDILKTRGFEIPCAICYVEQARQQEGITINGFCDGNDTGKLGWNSVLDSIEKKMKESGVEYKFPSLDRSVATDSYTPKSINMSETEQNAFYEALVELANEEIEISNQTAKKPRSKITRATPSAIKNVLKGTLNENLSIFKNLFNNPNARFRIDNDLLYSSETTMNLSYFHSDLYTLFNRQRGQAGYKTKQKPMVYWGDILNKKLAPATVRKEGGIRSQSNSDTQMYTFLDEVQRFIDYSAKGYYGHEYTKVLAKAKLFGLSNIKENISLIPKVKLMYTDGKLDVEKTRENAGLDENGNLLFDGVEGANADETFMLTSDKEYSKSLTATCIGYSDKHILKMLDDSRIQLIIGFHDTTNDTSKRYVGAKYSKNYNEENEATYKSTGKTKHIAFNDFVMKAEKAFKYDKESGKFDGTTTFNGKEFEANDIPKLAVAMYLDYCEQNNLNPAYSTGETDFSTHENYYKLLGDFGLYDSEGNYAPHRKVTFKLPEQVPYLDENGKKKYMSTKDYIKKEIEKELEVMDSISEALADESDDGIMAEFVRRVNESDAERYSLSDDSNGDDLTDESVNYNLEKTRITVDMDDADRAKILSTKNVVAPLYEGQADSEIENNLTDLNSGKIGLVKKAIITIGEEFGVFGENIQIEDVDVEISFSKSKLKESVSKEVTPTELAKLIPILKESVGNAIGIERHDNRYYHDSDTVYFENLLGGYADEKYFVPVRFGLKHSKSGRATLYVVVDQNQIPLESLDEIKKTEVVKATDPQKTELKTSRSVNYKISHIIPFVNSKDLLRYLPDSMLNEEQKSAKWKAIAETIRNTSNKNDNKYANFIREGNERAAKGMVNAKAVESGADTDSNGNPVILYHGTPTYGFTKFDRSRIGSNSGVGRGVFSFTTNKKAAEAYSGKNADSNYGDSNNLISGINKLLRKYDNPELNSLISYGETDEVQEWDADVVFDNAYEYDYIDFNYEPDDYDSYDEYQKAMHKAQYEGYVKYLNSMFKDYQKDADGKFDDFFKEVFDVINSTKQAKSGVYSVFVITKGKKVKEYNATKETYNDVAWKAIEDGNDVSILNLEDGERVYFVKNPEDIKSADLVTYDDDGNIIPLSQRFNDENDDMRYDLSEEGNKLETQKRIEEISQEVVTHEELIALAKKNTQEFVSKIKENKSLQKRLKNAKRQMLVSPNPVVNPMKVATVTKEILKEMDSTLKASDLKDEIISIYNEYFAEVKKAGGVESKTQMANEQMAKRFAELAVDIADSSEVYVESEMYTLLKSYIKDTRINIPDYAKGEADYAEFRKSHMGTFNLTNDGLDIDIVYQELCEMFPGMFDKEVANPTDQLYAIADKLESLKPYAYNPHSDYMQDAVEHIVYRFVSEADGLAVMQKTKAQKMAEKASVDKAMALDKEKTAFERKLEKHKKNSEKTIQKLQKKIDDADYVRYWEKRLSKEEKAHAVQEVRDRQKKALLKSRIRSIVSDMKKNMDKNEKSGGYPKELVKVAAEVCSAIDFHTGKTNKDGSPTKISLKLDALQLEYDALKNNENYDFQSEFSEELSGSIKALRRLVGDKRVIDLNVYELSELKDILSEISHRLSVATKQIGEANAKENAEIGFEIIESLNSRSDVIKSEQKQLLSEMKLFGQKGKSMIFNPHRINEMIAGYVKNSAWWKVYDGLNRGSRKASKFVMEANKPFDELTNDGGNEIAFYDFRTKNVKTGIKYIDGTEVLIPKSIVCELVMLWDRKQGRTHLETGGAKIPNMELYNKGKTTVAITDAGKRTMPITQSDITRLKGMLDSYDKAWIEKAHYLFNKVSKDAINETSMELIGRELAKTENYIRMYVDQDFIRREIDGKKDDATLESHGSLKETVPNAKQPVVLRGLHENVYDNIDFVSKYYGLAIPIRNFNKVYNIVINDGNTRNSVKELIGQKFGSAIRSGVVEQLIRDLQAPRSRNIEPFGGIRGKWLGATFWGNISSTLKQTTSYWTAAAIVGEDSLVKGLKNFAKSPKQTKAEISKHSGTLYKRSQGLSTTELGDRANRKRLAGASNMVTKLINEKAPVLRKIPNGIRPENWLQSMDCTVSAALWEACKVEVSKTMSASDDGYMQAVTDLWERVIEETQSNYDVMHRPEALKNTSTTMKTLTMFQTDNLQQTGIIYSAFGDFRTKSELFKKDNSEANQKAKDEAKTRLEKAIRSRLWSAMWLPFMTFMGAMLLRKFKPYKDEEENDITASSVLKQISLDMCGDMFGVFVPIGGELITKAVDTWKYGYDFVEDPAFNAVQVFIEATSKIWDEASDGGDVMGALVDAIPAISNVTGLPIKNISDLVKSIRGYVGDIKELDFAHDIADYKTKSPYSYGDLASCISTGDAEKEKKILNYYSNNGKEVSTSALTKEIKPAYVQMYIDSPEKARGIAIKLVREYKYSADTINKWAYDEYLDNVVSDFEYAEEIKNAFQSGSSWKYDAFEKAAKSYYKDVYKSGKEEDIEKLKNALINDAKIAKGTLAQWERDADNEASKAEMERQQDINNLQ